MSSFQDYYRILGVKYSASQEEIEDAYHKLARELHPDMTGGDEELTERYMAVNQAYQVLSRPKDRAEYNKAIGIEGVSMDGGGRPAAKIVHRDESPAQDMRILDAKLRKAIKGSGAMCKKGNYWEATRILERFLKSHPEHPGLRKALARAALGRKRYHEAVNHMKIVCKVEYHDPDNYVELGWIYLEAGQFVLAEKALREALGWNAEHEEALKLKKSLQERKDAGKPSIQRIFGKISKAFKH